jgi:hypothetical protein
MKIKEQQVMEKIPTIELLIERRKRNAKSILFISVFFLLFLIVNIYSNYKVAVQKNEFQVVVDSTRINERKRRDAVSAVKAFYEADNARDSKKLSELYRDTLRYFYGDINKSKSNAISSDIKYWKKYPFETIKIVDEPLSSVDNDTVHVMVIAKHSKDTSKSNLPEKNYYDLLINMSLDKEYKIFYIKTYIPERKIE